MNWTAPIDLYCERLGAGFWAEPLNALSNAAFVMAALYIYPRVKDVRAARHLTLILAAIGCGSFAFHRFADRWSMLADVVPIFAFAILYLDVANRDYLSLGAAGRMGALLVFFAAAALITPLVAQVPIIGVSAGYAALPVAMVVYGLMLRAPAPRTARGLITSGALLSLSIVLRSVDGPLCEVWPWGTHIGWHLLNAVVLAYLIHVYHAHMLVRQRGSR